jgi:predicted transcriptional regulator
LIFCENNNQKIRIIFIDGFRIITIYKFRKNANFVLKDYFCFFKYVLTTRGYCIFVKIFYNRELQNMTKDFNILVKKLIAFRSKYYSFKIVRGLLLTIFFLLAIFLFFVFLESLLYMPSNIRIFIFYGFFVFGLLLSVHYIIVPFFRLIGIIKPLNIKSSSFIIQNHFREIEDKLLNIIELSELKDNNYSADIIEASIDQKINKLSIFDFRDAVQFRNLKIILVYFIVSVLVATGIFFINRSLVSTSVQRIIHYDEVFTKPAPFNFYLVNDDLIATKGESFKILLECRGDKLPQVVYINIEGNNYLMNNISEGNFEFDIASVINPINFYFTDMKNNSEKFLLDILPAPGITNFRVEIKPPFYTGISDESYINTGDFQVTEGTKIKWYFDGIDIDSLFLFFSDSTTVGASKCEKFFVVDKVFNESHKYNVYIKNDMTDTELALSYSIDVIPDLYPEIELLAIQDSTKITRYFFKGLIGDDYGFTGLDFHFNVENKDSSISIPFIKNLKDQEFYFSYDFADLSLPSGIITYYFSVTDNDIINNYKTTTSDSYTITIPDEDEISKIEDEKFRNIEEMLNESRELANEIQGNLKQLRIKNMDTNVSDWENSQMVNDIVTKQNRLENLYNKIKKNNENLNNYTNSFKEERDEIIEKQKQIEKLLDEVFTDELKKLLDEFNKLAEEFDSKKINRLTDRMDMTYEDLQKQLDRNLEMLRKMKVEQKLQNIIDEIKAKGKEEEKLSDDIRTNEDFDSIKEYVKDHKDDITELQKQLGIALEMNNELDKPLNFDDFSEEFDETRNNMMESIKHLENKKKDGSWKSIKKTSGSLENIALAMQKMLDSNDVEQKTENIENLRQILSNLILISFEQEDILKTLNVISAGDPVLNELNLKQKQIKDQSKIVRDSLYALAKRTAHISNMINNELLTLQFNLENVTTQMEEGLFPNAKSSQQYIITSVNNLALMLNEALENLEEQLANAKPGTQQCERPGGKCGGLNLLKKTSENIRKQLEQMIEQLKNGQRGPGQEQYGQMLMRHEMMQQMLREIMNDGNIGSPARNHLQQIDRILEHNRQELINRNINAEMIARQRQITARLLEAENAEMERDFDKKRESKVAEDFYSDPVEFFEFNKEKDVVIEIFNKNSHKLSNFYNKKYKEYLNNFENR